MNSMKNGAWKSAIIPRFIAIALQAAVWLALLVTSVFAAVPSILNVIIQKNDGLGTNRVAVQFTEVVYGDVARTLGLAPGNFTLSGISALAVSAVDHALGSDTAILTLDAAALPYVSGVFGVVLIDGSSIYSSDAQFASGSAFDLASAITDGVPPVMSAVFSVNNVSQPHTVTVSFDEALGDKAAVETPANWTLTCCGADHTYSISSVALSTDRKKVTLTLPPVNPASHLTYITNSDANGHLQLTPTAAIVDRVGNPQGGGAVTGSNEILTLDNTAPMVSAILTKIDDTHFKLGFSEKVESSSANNYLYYTLSGSGGLSGNPSTAQLQANGTDVNITVADTSGFALGQTLLVTATNVEVGVTDIAGNLPGANNVATYTYVTLPGVPTGISVSAGNGQITVSFSAPASDGGSPITGYTASCAPYSQMAAFEEISNTGGASPITVSGLTNGTPYKCRAKATNSLGYGNYSALSAEITPTAPPYDPGPYVPPLPPPPVPIPTPSGDSTPISNPGELVTNPDANITITSDNGAAIISAPPTDPYILSPKAPENALVMLPTNQPVGITSGGTTLTYTDKQGGAQLVVRTVNGQPQLEVAKGVVAISSGTPGSVIPVISVDLKSVGTVTTTTNADSVVVVKTDKSALVFVETGKVDYQGAGQGASGVSVYNGENAKLNNASGQLNQIVLGSLDGQKQVPGDPLPPQPGYAPDTLVPNLAGNLPRFDNALSLLDILRDAIQEVLGDTSGQISYDKTSGVVTYILGNQGYRLIPLGEVQVLLNQLGAANVTSTAGGAYSLASRGIQMSLSSAVGYFSDLQQAVRELDAKGEITLKPSGVLEMTVGGNRYAGIPGMAASLPAQPTPLPGFETGSGGLAVFRDHLGVVQTLYPAFMDVDSVAAALRSVDPAVSVTNNGNGTLTVRISGQTYLFLPEYQVTAAPASHPSEAWWQDGGVIYIRNSDNSVQGFRLQ